MQVFDLLPPMVHVAAHAVVAPASDDSDDGSWVSFLKHNRISGRLHRNNVDLCGLTVQVHVDRIRYFAASTRSFCQDQSSTSGFCAQDLDGDVEDVD